MNGRIWLLLGGTLGMLAVILGAFGAHGLEKAVTQWGLDVDEQASRLDNWEVAVRYQMYHALALLLVGILAANRPSRIWHAAGIAFLAGIFIFSGCLYLYVFSGWKIFGMIVPIGGVFLIVGWAAMMTAIWQTCGTAAAER
jgi:uncharacterized membrane protein YgdD (TMEM256/DUF423 family)